MKNIITLSLALSSALLASEITLEKVVVTAGKQDEIKNSDTIGLKNPSDTASLLADKAGVAVNTGGGISSLPSIHGMADDRINTTVDGMQITSACPNHMNPAMSYIDSSKVKSVSMIAGIAPVSEGGDSIAGSVAVKSKEPLFSKNGELAKEIAISTFYRSNNHNQGVSGNLNVANDKLSFGYSGFAEKAENYSASNGTQVADTLYKQQNQSAFVAYKADIGVTKFTIGNQMIPYQGFPNQYMDMNGNKSTFGNISFDGKIGNKTVEANVFKRDTEHYMNKILSERTGNMPMYTEADEIGYNIKFSIPLQKEHIVKIGSDMDKFKLDDWWPAATTTYGGMGPNTFWNINNGHRDRIGFFVESNYRWSEKLSSNIGVRTDIVSMNTDNVVGYNNNTGLASMYNDKVDADAFNAKDRKKTDNNYDITASFMYEHSSKNTYEFGYARKTRSPNLYERYSWAGGYQPAAAVTASGPIAMDMAMINWVGDGNGYVGNIDLKPETANTFSATATFSDGKTNGWELKITPYYTFVQNYIDADLIGTAGAGGYAGIALLRFANHDAVLFGADISADMRVLSDSQYGTVDAKLISTYTRGYRTDGSGSLYHIMPLNGKLILSHSKGDFKNSLSVQAVASKDQVNGLRREPTTPGYALVDVKTNYRITKNIDFDFSITNLFDKNYSLPLGGVNTIGTAKTSKISLLGEGRSFNTAINIKF